MRDYTDITLDQVNELCKEVQLPILSSSLTLIRLLADIAEGPLVPEKTLATIHGAIETAFALGRSYERQHQSGTVEFVVYDEDSPTCLHCGKDLS